MPDMSRSIEPNREALVGLAAAMAAASPGALRLARNEADESEAREPEAATFLKLDGRRHGRDLEIYDLMATIHGNWQPVLPDLAIEIVLPLRSDAPEAYAIGVEGMLAMGRATYDPERQDAWADIFAEPVPLAP